MISTKPIKLIPIHKPRVEMRISSTRRDSVTCLAPNARDEINPGVDRRFEQEFSRIGTCGDLDRHEIVAQDRVHTAGGSLRSVQIATASLLPTEMFSNALIDSFVRLRIRISCVRRLDRVLNDFAFGETLRAAFPRI